MNAQGGILSVSNINEYIKALLECDDFLSGVFVRGEISNLTYHKSGHIYFTLKDAGGVLKAVMFRSAAGRVKFALKEGMSIICAGRISAYAPTGQYQLYVENVQPDGIGALAIAFEQIKEKLKAEGLFDEVHKKPLPEMPMRVGVITSPTGAAIHDMINVMTRRFPLAEIVLYPALVQGEGAPASLVSGVEYFNKTNDVDLVIIGRGGGSIEDLWGFNSVDLAYAIYNSHLPVISAVGHETDFTICDFVADKRAPTPSAAAELAVPDIIAIKQDILAKSRQMLNTLSADLARYRERIKMLQNSRVLLSKESLLDEYKMKISLSFDKLDALVEKKLTEKKNIFSLLSGKLSALSPLNTLARGYAIAQGEDGKTVNSIKSLSVGDRLKMSFADGEVISEISEINGGRLCPQKKN